jgi:hypothetical protein
MTRQRLDDLLAALATYGWLPVVEDSHGELFELIDDRVTWTLEHSGGRSTIELTFHAFGDLGQRVRDLRDILYCVDTVTGAKLYFHRRGSPDWQRELLDFVERLRP